jgi:hypothetical protein
LGEICTLESAGGVLGSLGRCQEVVRLRAMAEFSSTDSYRRFEQTAKRETRYVYDVEVRDFLAAVMFRQWRELAARILEK